MGNTVKIDEVGSDRPSSVGLYPLQFLLLVFMLGFDEFIWWILDGLER